MTHPAHWFAASYALLALASAQRNGQYTPTALWLGLASFAAACAAGWLLARGRGRGEVSTAVLGGALVVTLLAGVDVSPLVHDKNLWVDRVMHAGEWLLLAFALIAYVLGYCPERWRTRLALGFIAAGVASHALVPVLSRTPTIDAFTMAQESAAHLLAGANPYTAPVTDPYRGERDDLHAPETYAYPPTALFLQLPFFALLGDVRWASVLGDLAIALTLWRLARRRPVVREPMVLLFLWHPRGMFVLEQGWTEPLIALGLCAWLMLHLRGHRTAAAAVMGLTLGIKQYLVLAGMHWLRAERSVMKLAVAAGTIAFVMLPFALWDTPAFIENALLFQLRNPFRQDSLTLAAGLGLEPGRGWTLLVGLLVTAVTMAAFRRLDAVTATLAGLTLTLFATFLFGAQAFCNYYWLVWTVMLLTIAILARKETAIESSSGNDQITPSSPLSLL